MKKNEFKVIPWLRSISEKHSEKIEGMTPAEIMSESKKRKKIKPLNSIDLKYIGNRNTLAITRSPKCKFI